MNTDTLKEYAGRRILIVNSRIGDDFMHQLKDWLITLNLDQKPVLLMIDSEGGGMSELFGIIDIVPFMQKTPVIGLVNGKCFSAAMDLLQICNVRLATPCSRFRLHYMRASAFFSAHQSDSQILSSVNRRIAELRQNQEKIVQLYAKRMKVPEEGVKALMNDGEKNETSLDALEALRLGIIDGIVDNPEDVANICSSLEHKPEPP